MACAFLCMCLKCYKGANKLEIIMYTAIFIIGTLLGSFFSLAIYRIPLKQDITHKRSYCPKCNHRLGFWDMIPILSYIFLGGKCRYCKDKIRPRYICLEIFSGVLFLLFALALKINIYSININKIVYLLFGIFYIATLFIIGGIEKENHTISKPVIILGLIIEMIYMIYLCVVNINMYKYVICSILLIIIALINVINIKENYTIQILNLYLYLVIGTGVNVSNLSMIVLLAILSTLSIINNCKIKKDNKTKNDLKQPIGFYLCFTNIIVLIIYNFLK